MAAKSREPEQGLLYLLEHPLRKWLLCLYIEDEEALSPKYLADYTKKNLSTVGYHVRQLAEYGALDLVDTKSRRGAVQHFYRPTKLAQETPWVLAVLGLPTGALELAERRAFRKRLKQRAEEDRPVLERLRKSEEAENSQAKKQKTEDT